MRAPFICEMKGSCLARQLELSSILLGDCQGLSALRLD